MKKTTVICALPAALLAAVPVEAARILYAYADTAGRAAVAITDGFVSSRFETVGTELCLTAGATCSEARFLNTVTTVFFPIDPAGGSSAVTFGDVGFGTEGTYTASNGGALAELAIVALRDADVVYAYADTAGRAAIAVTDGYTNARFESVGTKLCLTAGATCSEARFLNTVATVFFPVNPAGGSSAVTFGNVGFATQGTFTAMNGGALGQLAVVGPAISAVPEPASWFMLISGLGAIGTTLRRRVVAARAGGCADARAIHGALVETVSVPAIGARLVASSASTRRTSSSGKIGFIT